MAAIDDWNTIKRNLPNNSATLSAWANLLANDVPIDQLLVISHQARSVHNQMAVLSTPQTVVESLKEGVDISVDFTGLPTAIDSLIAKLKAQIPVDANGFILDRKLDANGLMTLVTIPSANLVEIANELNSIKGIIDNVAGMLP